MSAHALEQGSSVTAARRALAGMFRAQGLESPELDARLLVGHVLGLDHTGVVVSDRTLTPAEAERIAALGQRRLAHEPVARILGVKEFWGVPLDVTADVLVPRPETETLVESALAAIAATSSAANSRAMREFRIADLGTGSGAILLALLHELPDALGVGTDRSVAALVVARRNASRLGLAQRAHFIACDYGQALASGFDLVAANPPYIPTWDIAGLARDVRDFDPRAALDGGADGLDGARAVVVTAARLLRPGGTLVMEFGIGQGQVVETLVADAGLTVNELRPDLAGISRVIVAANPCR